jgi:hypothetical protein
MFSSYFTQPPNAPKRPFDGARLERWINTAESVDKKLELLPGDIRALYAGNREVLAILIAVELDNDPLKPKVEEAKESENKA